MAGKYGVKETLEVLDLGFSLVNAVKEAQSDGKINFLDAIHLIPVMPKVDAAITEIATVPSELGELDEQDVFQVLEYSKTKLGTALSDVDLRTKTFAVLRAGLYVANAVAVVRG